MPGSAPDRVRLSVKWATPVAGGDLSGPGAKELLERIHNNSGPRERRGKRGHFTFVTTLGG
eukprot:7105090-Pyramimonas_sp.AAC.1